MGVLPTIKIKHEDGFAIINKADFDPDIHKALDGKVPKKQADTVQADIPKDWQDQHWKTRVKLAKELGFDVKNVDEADAAILKHLEAQG